MASHDVLAGDVWAYRRRVALAVPTRRQIFGLVVSAADPMTVTELATECGVHPNTVRLHLNSLLGAGLVAEEASEAEGRRGRPSRRYRAAGLTPVQDVRTEWERGIDRDRVRLMASTPLRVLSDEECEELLRRHRFGRLALGLEGWPAILPVNYMYEGSSVVIRTAPGAKLDEGPLTTVAFEIDGADRFGFWGWSVLVQGPLLDITTSIDELSDHLRTLPVRPWVPGAHDHWLKLTVVRMSGRAFGDVELDD